MTRFGFGNLGGTRGQNERLEVMTNVGLMQGGSKGLNQWGLLGMDAGAVHGAGGVGRLKRDDKGKDGRTEIGLGGDWGFLLGDQKSE